MKTEPDETEMLLAFIRHYLRPAKALPLIIRIFLTFLPSGCISGAALAESSGDAVFLPSLSDPRRRADEPSASARKPIRFLTADDYPPFEFLDAFGNLTGYNVDIARAICDELKVTCTIQPRRWDNLLDALEAKEGDALIASLKPSAAGVRAHFTDPYYLTPARFVALSGSDPFDARPEGLRGKKIGVEAGSAHEAFLRKFFSGSKLEAFPDRDKLMAALREKQVELIFGDAIALSLRINETPTCCSFQGGPYLEPAYFGEGIGIGVRPEDNGLRHTLNWALQRLDENGKLTEYYLKYFPIGIY